MNYKLLRNLCAAILRQRQIIQYCLELDEFLLKYIEDNLNRRMMISDES